jgi:hypothetical protein
MSLWGRVSAGVYLCGAVGGAAIISAVLSSSDALIMQGIGGLFGAVVYMFGLVAFTLGLVIIVVGLIGHLRSFLAKRAPDA